MKREWWGGYSLSWKYTPLYEKDMKETQNKPMETTLWRVQTLKNPVH